MAETKIVHLNEYRATQTLETAVVDRQKLSYRREAKAQVGGEYFDSRQDRETTFFDLYSNDSPAGALISRVRELLYGMANRVRDAQELLTSDDLVGADQEVTLIQADLPELFCCKDISEGMAAFTLALHYALLNRKDETLNVDQLYTMRSCIEYLCENPIIGFDKGLDLIDQLTEGGFITDPPEAKESSA